MRFASTSVILSNFMVQQLSSAVMLKFPWQLVHLRLLHDSRGFAGDCFLCCRWSHFLSGSSSGFGPGQNASGESCRVKGRILGAGIQTYLLEDPTSLVLAQAAVTLEVLEQISSWNELHDQANQLRHHKNLPTVKSVHLQLTLS